MRSATWTCSGVPNLRRTKNGKSQSPCRHFYIDRLQQWIDDNGLAGGDGLFGYSGRWSVNQAIELVCDTADLKARVIRMEKVEGKTEKRRVILGSLVMEYYTSHQVGRRSPPRRGQEPQAGGGGRLGISGRTTFAQRHQEAL